MKPTLYILLGFCVLWRLCVPTVIDTSPTSLCKDFSHLVVAFVFGWSAASLNRGCGSEKELHEHGWLMSTALAISLFELWAALCTKGPIIP